MTNRSVIAGFGGQGVMMIGKLLCYASLDHGKHALFLPSYGTEQRGGTANCTIILSDEEVGSPMTAHIDTLIAMNEPSLKKFQNMVKPGGTVYINSSLIKPEDVREDVSCTAVPVDDLAHELGSTKVANIIMLSAYAAGTGLFTKDEVTETVLHKLASKPQFLELNRKAIETGFEHGRK